MEKKPVEIKTIKTIVPIKGNLLEKIKNKLRHNGNTSQHSDVLNNNKEDKAVTPSPQDNLNKERSKILIQKVENVHLEIDNIINNDSSFKSDIIKSSSSLIIRPANSPSPAKVVAKSIEQSISTDLPIPTKEKDQKVLPKDNVNSVICEEINQILPCSSKSLDCSEEKSSIVESKKYKEVKKQEDSGKNVETKANSSNKNNNNIVSDEEEEGECMDIEEEEWLHDINVMIGEPRIREIDQSLKKIPMVVTGNRIQTENVELKLIINHLLKKLNVASVAETLGNTSLSFYDHATDTPDEDDYFDDDMYDTTTESNKYNDDEIPREVSTISAHNKSEGIIDQTSFSIPLSNENSELLAVVTIPPVISNDGLNDEQNKREKNEDQKCENMESSEIVEKPTKRKGRFPLAASTAKKAKISTANKSDNKAVVNNNPRKFTLRNSSRESSVESDRGTKVRETSKSPIKQETEISKTKTLESSLHDESKKTPVDKDNSSLIKNNSKKVTRVQEIRDSEVESSAVKLSESSLSSSDCENEKKSRRRSSRKSKPKSDSSQKITNFFKRESKSVEKNESSLETTKSATITIKQEKDNGEMVKKINGKTNKKQTRRSTRKILSESESETECEKNTSCKTSELKSITPNDFSSQSTILERYDYLNKPSLSVDKKRKDSLISNHPICADLENVLIKSKEQDPTYLKPPEIVKRPYLKTSAFTGNHINSDDTLSVTDSCTQQQPSVSCDDSSVNNITSNPEIQCNAIIMNSPEMNTKPSEIKDIIKELINKEKDKIHVKYKEKQQHDVQQQLEEISNNKRKTKSRESTPGAPHVTRSVRQKRENTPKAQMSSKKPRNIKETERSITKRKMEVEKKVFVQEETEDAVEKMVCYDDIIEAIRISDPPRKNGRASSVIKPLEAKKKIEIESKLKSLKHFKCGSCTCLVTKHKWKYHLIDHGGMAWIDSFESPIDINDWNESIRRLNNYMRIYKLECYVCPNCDCIKKSALGHLSHIYTCGEDEETIERRKAQCQYCEERVMPFIMSSHRSKCKGLNKQKTTASEIIAEDGDDEEDANDVNSRESSVTGGRAKRKAGKKAAKKFKTFLKNMDDDPMEHMTITTKGEFVCNHCSAKFDKKESAVDHLDKNHSDKKEGEDFEGSSSDASIRNIEESSSETDGSSGVESSDVQSAEDDDDDDHCGSVNVSNSKGKQSSCDSQEVKNGRHLISPYAESLHNVRFSSRTTKLTKEFIDENLCDNILAKGSPKYKIIDSINLASYLESLKLNLLSMKLDVKTTDTYPYEYGNTKITEWKQLDVGKSVEDKNSFTMFCGGSVSSLDWSQSMKGKNFLAVACNSSKNKSFDLEATSKSYIQIYQFENLVNEKFSSYEKCSKLLYFFTINEGPIWSIKFHPFVVPNNERIGLLAVTSSNHHIYVYALPYLPDIKESSVMINMEPSYMCKTVDDVWLFQDKYLMQATHVTWFYRKHHDLHFLGAGFVNGMISVWKFSDDEGSVEHSSEETKIIYPYLTFQPHHEPITGLDFKYMLGSEILLLTSSLDRNIKVFSIDNNGFQEISSHYATSRIFCAEWWLHWPGFVCGNDSCYTHGSFLHRQPLEFGLRYMQLFFCMSSVIGCAINHWMNAAVFVTDGGDVLCTNPSQLIHSNPKDRWGAYGNNVLSYTDVISVNEKGSTEDRVVFCDLKSKLSKRPKEFRIPTSSDSISQLQINQISFNRNESSYRFYALGYETGFIRIRHLKNSK